MATVSTAFGSIGRWNAVFMSQFDFCLLILWMNPRLIRFSLFKKEVTEIKSVKMPMFIFVDSALLHAGFSEH
jgi:hypothetical protein